MTGWEDTMDGLIRRLWMNGRMGRQDSLCQVLNFISHKQSAALSVGMGGIWIYFTQPGLGEVGLDCMGLGWFYCSIVTEMVNSENASKKTLQRIWCYAIQCIQRVFVARRMGYRLRIFRKYNLFNNQVPGFCVTYGGAMSCDDALGVKVYC